MPVIFKIVASALLVFHVLAAVSWAEDREPTEAELAEANVQLDLTRREKPKEFRQYVTMVQMALGAFGFGVGPFDGVLDTRTTEALRKYQQVRGFTPNGKLDAKTFHYLLRDFKVSRENTAILLPGKMVVTTTWDAGFVKAQGTWTIVGEASARPVQTTELVCYRERRLCFESTAMFNMSNNFLHSVAEIHEIERWDQHEIVTKPMGSAICVRYTLRIGRLPESITSIRLRVSESDFCKHVTPELHLKIVDGMEVMRAISKESGSKLQGVFQAPGLDKR
jgi:hypothetical protein